MKAHSNSRKPRGFTLVELLVVIAIILALAGLSIMAINIGKNASNAAKSASNMKAIYTSLTAITSEGVNTGMHAPDTFPPYKGTLQDDDVSFVWWDLVAESVGNADRDTGRYRWKMHFSETVMQNPLSKKTLGGGKTEWDSLYNDPDVSHGGYAYNAKLGGDVSANAQEENIFKVRMSRIEDGPNTIYFAEADDEQATAGWVFRNMANAPQGNHKDKVHCCMVDGHVEILDNQVLKNQPTFDFYTDVEEKNYGNQP